MKIGITVDDYYKKYLEEISSLNNLSITSICGLIVENFLSYNQKNKKFPLFKTSVSIVFAEKVDKSTSAKEEDSTLSRDDILASLSMDDD